MAGGAQGRPDPVDVPSDGAAPWLEAIRRACDRAADGIAAMPPQRRALGLGRGAGGDETLELDRLAETAVLEELEALARPLRVVSEEAGERVIGGGGPAVVVVDPIDGSLNAKRGLPPFATSVAVAQGPRLDDVWLGLVRDHGTGEEYVAERGRGAWRDGVPLGRPATVVPGRLELVLLEGAMPSRLARAAGVLDGRAGRLRAIGSLALSLCAVAAGRGDAMAGLGPGRAVDIAAGQLVAREAGVTVGLPDVADLAGAPLDATTRRHVVAAWDPAALPLLRRALG